MALSGARDRFCRFPLGLARRRERNSQQHNTVPLTAKKYSTAAMTPVRNTFEGAKLAMKERGGGFDVVTGFRRSRDGGGGGRDHLADSRPGKGEGGGGGWGSGGEGGRGGGGDGGGGGGVGDGDGGRAGGGGEGAHRARISAADAEDCSHGSQCGTSKRPKAGSDGGPSVSAKS